MATTRNSRSLMGRLFSAFDREEQGRPPVRPATPGDTLTGEDARMFQAGADPRIVHSSIATTQADALIPKNDKLLVFRALTGIDSVPALTSHGHLRRMVPNVGIYVRVVEAERSTNRQFKFFSILINACLGLQIVVAAALTAIGAANGSSRAVTGLGAINTIMAGALTYLKSSGLPERLRHARNEWKNLREYIELREREFCLIDSDLDVQQEVNMVIRMYEAIKSEIEATKNSESHFRGAEPGPDRPYGPTIKSGARDGYDEKRLSTSHLATPEPALDPQHHA